MRFKPYQLLIMSSELMDITTTTTTTITTEGDENMDVSSY